MKDPTFRQLKNFLAVVETGSFRQAASRLGLSQPTLTAQIATLEESLGVTLLERTRRGAQPTPIGRDLVSPARAVIESMTALKDRVALVEEGPKGTHRLGVPPTLGPYLLPYVVPKLHERFPALKLYVREGPPRDLERELIEGRHDCILTPLPVVADGLSVQPLFEESLRVVVPTDHPFADKEYLEERDLAGEGILALEEKHHLYGQVRELASNLGARLLRDYEGSSLDTLRQMVGMGMGLAFLPALYIRSEIVPGKSEVRVLRLKGKENLRLIGLAWRSTSVNGQLYRSFAEIIRGVGKRDFDDFVRVISKV